MNPKGTKNIFWLPLGFVQHAVIKHWGDVVAPTASLFFKFVQI